MIQNGGFMGQQLNALLAGAALDSAPIGILIFDKNERLVWANKTLEKLFCINKQDLEGQPASDFVGKKYQYIFSFKERFFLESINGNPERWLKCWQEKSENNDETIRYYLDVTTEHQLQLSHDQLKETLEKQTTHDPVTGLFNKRGIQEILEPLISRSRRYENDLSIIRMRLNSGQKDPLISEQGLKTAGCLLKDKMRWADHIGHLGGGDFLLVLPETTGASAEKLAIKLCSIIEGLKINHAGQEVSISVCCGIAMWIKGDNITTLLQRAEVVLQDAINENHQVLVA